MGAADDNQGVLHSWKDARGDFKTSRLFSVCCEQVSSRQVIWMQEIWPQTCYHHAGRPEAGGTGALGLISELWEIPQQWNADGVPASQSTAYRRIKEMGYSNRIPRMKASPEF